MIYYNMTTIHGDFCSNNCFCCDMKKGQAIPRSNRLCHPDMKYSNISKRLLSISILKKIEGPQDSDLRLRR